MLRLVQLQHPQHGRRAALVEGDTLHFLQSYSTLYACALAAIESGGGLRSLVQADVSDNTLDYDAVYNSASEWRMLPAFDHPDEPARCLISGTGLTHRKSADNRNAMHQAANAGAAAITDSMRMYEWGVEGGRPEPGKIGAQPEWFYKGCGTILRAHGESLDIPAFADDGGEEGEIAGAYVVDGAGQPWRVGFAIGNEFSDHEMERKNYLYLAPSKLRTCALGPELVVGAAFDNVTGSARIKRNGETVWSQPLASGEEQMVHTLENLEHHQFKYPAHRRPGDVHLHFFGAGAFSFGAGIKLEDGDVMEIGFERLGRPLRNPVRLDRTPPRLAQVRALT